MLSIFSIICFYGATASLANCMFGKDLMMMGPPLFTVGDFSHDGVTSLGRRGILGSSVLPRGVQISTECPSFEFLSAI